LRFSFATGLFLVFLASASVSARADEMGAPTVSQPPVATAAQATDQQSPDVQMWASAAAAKFNAAPSAEKPRHAIARFASRILARTSMIARGLTRDALRLLGTPYAFGGTSPSGFDCSGYVQHVFAMIGVHLPRTADAQYDAGSRIRGGMQPGDLVFFQTYEPGPSHVGIYLGNGRFAHASSSHGVTISSLSDSYWAPRFIGAKRVAASR